MELRRWFRQTKAHNTMVLGNTAEHEETGAENINKAAGTLLLSKDENEYQLIVTEIKDIPTSNTVEPSSTSNSHKNSLYL